MKLLNENIKMNLIFNEIKSLKEFQQRYDPDSDCYPVASFDLHIDEISISGFYIYMVDVKSDLNFINNILISFPDNFNVEERDFRFEIIKNAEMFFEGIADTKEFLKALRDKFFVNTEGNRLSDSVSSDVVKKEVNTEKNTIDNNFGYKKEEDEIPFSDKSSDKLEVEQEEEQEEEELIVDQYDPNDIDLDSLMDSSMPEQISPHKNTEDKNLIEKETEIKNEESKKIQVDTEDIVKEKPIQETEIENNKKESASSSIMDSDIDFSDIFNDDEDEPTSTDF